jgi:hypothetical protein
MITTEKTTRTLNGMLMRPLAVGSNAIIFHQGKFTRTSPIVAISRLGAEEVYFETLNTKYHLLTGPSTQPAASLFPMAFAA